MNLAVASAVLRFGGLALVLVALTALVHPDVGLVGYRRWVVALLVVATVAVALTVPVRLPSRWARRWLMPAVAIGAGAVCTVVALLGRHTYGWDARILMRMARTLDRGEPLPPAAYDYLSLYPNTVPQLALDRVAVSLGQRLGLAPEALLVAGNGIALTLTLAAVGFLALRAAGLGSALLAMGVVVVLVGASPWMAVPYTDIPATPLVTGAVALAVAATDPRPARTRALLWAGAALAASAAFVVKTTPAVVLVAMLLLLATLTFARPVGSTDGRRRLLAGLAGAVTALAAFGLGAVGLGEAATAVSGVDESRIRVQASPPLAWWLANGMGYQPSGRGGGSYGTYDATMVIAIRGRSQVEMSTYAHDVIARHWDERGVPGTAQFYANKAVWNWGDGMFWAWGEGADVDSAVPVHDGPLSEALAEVQSPRGELFRVRSDLTQAWWVVVLLVGGCGALVTSPRRDSFLLMTVLLGLAAFTLLFQGRSRYVLAYVPLLATLAAITLPALRARTVGLGPHAWVRAAAAKRAAASPPEPAPAAPDGRPRAAVGLRTTSRAD